MFPDARKNSIRYSTMRVTTICFIATCVANAVKVYLTLICSTYTYPKSMIRFLPFKYNEVKSLWSVDSIILYLNTVNVNYLL